MTRSSKLTTFALLMIPIVFCSLAQANLLKIGVPASLSLDSGQSIQSFEFLSDQNGPLEVTLNLTANSDPVQIVLTRIRPNGSELIMGSAKVEPASPARLFLYPSAGLWSRALVSLQDPSGSATFTLAARGLDTYASRLLVKEATQSKLISAGTQNQLATLPVGATGTFLFSPDGAYLLAGYSLYNAWNGEKIGDIPDADSDSRFFFVTDIPRLLERNPGRSHVRLFDLPNLTQIGSWEGNRFALPIHSQQFAVSGGSSVYVLDTKTGTPLFDAWTAPAETEVQFSPDGNTLIASAPTAVPCPVQIFNIRSQTSIGILRLWAQLESITFSPDGSRLLITGVNTEDDYHRAEVYSTTNGNALNTPILSTRELSGEFTLQSDRFVVYPAEPASSAAPVYLLNAENGEILAHYDSFRPLEKIRYHPYGDTMILQGLAYRSGLIEPELKLIDPQTGDQIQQFNPYEIQKFAYSLDGNRFYLLEKSYSENQLLEEIQLLDGLTGELLSTGNNWRLEDWGKVLFSADSERLISQNNSYLYILSILRKSSDGTQLYLSSSANETSAFTGSIQAQGESMDSSRYYYIGGYSNLVKLQLVNLKSGYRVRSDIYYEEVSQVAQNPDGTLLAYLCKHEGETSNRLEILNLANGEIRSQESLPAGEAVSLLWSGDGIRLLVGFTDGDKTTYALIRQKSLEIQMLIDSPSQIVFDYTRYPSFDTYDLNLDGKVSGRDLPYLGTQLDPDFMDVFLDYISYLR